MVQLLMKFAALPTAVSMPGKHAAKVNVRLPAMKLRKDAEKHIKMSGYPQMQMLSKSVQWLCSL